MLEIDWMPLISFVVTIVILLASFIGGYAVLRKKVQDLEKSNDEKLDENDHEKLCKIASLEMKGHVSDAMKETFDGFKREVFKPAMKELLKAINGGT